MEFFSTIFLSILLYYIFYKYKKNKILIVNNNSNENRKILNHLNKDLNSYNPTIYLPNCISMIIYNLLLKEDKIDYKNFLVKARDNCIIKLNYYGTLNKNNPLIIFKFGVNGNSNIPYVTSFCKTMNKNNFNVIIVNDRKIKNSNSSKILSDSDNEDMEDCIEFINKEFSNSPKFICGISKGGNDWTRFLGQTKNLYNIKSAFMIGNPFDYLKMVCHINNSLMGKVINGIILKGYEKKIKNKFIYNDKFNKLSKKYDFPISNEEIKKIKTIYEFDDKITSKVCGFDNVNDLYKYTSSKYYVKDVKIPILFLNSMEDIISKKEYIPLDDIYDNEKCILLLTERGGHVEFYNNFKCDLWAYELAAKYFKMFI